LMEGWAESLSTSVLGVTVESSEYVV